MLVSEILPKELYPFIIAWKVCNVSVIINNVSGWITKYCTRREVED